ncbi:NirA family protein (plasmid) [Methylocystis sp. MJC1]|jgi:ferredoxin-nitrite reductase|uniref:NirA family protein n=1 Tax=Methylocystis sp. MJC1 TaxID=2654282 RepID=UPI0013EAD887|nr:NirA family protein [Methylocystis sp. MJC1]KAF2989089.1 Sulfite reductase [ferredoxin] [Methylocystis sp. MJC1]MBU6529132.1 NirA family protein [Methylocystis sp. MJC1]UZX14066.1 NirA family protein [Methylocystis sp. MJC1]
MSADFTLDQKRYLEGFAAGLFAHGGRAATATPKPMGPDAAHLEAQDHAVAVGGKLTDQEKWKREEHPFDAYPRLVEQANENAPPKPAENFRWRYYGLFYVAPAQSAYMLRLRIPNGALTHWQFAGLADLAEAMGGGYLHVTTRANLQIRQIEPRNAATIVEAVQDLGLWSKGSGADNVRNITGTPTAGVDPQELIDTRPYARAMHHHILNDRSLYGLPRKFNIAFDGAGLIGALEDTNDIGFQAVEILDGHGIAPGVYFRLTLGGITGHKDFARDTGVIVRPEEAVGVADKILRVFIEHGDRTNRAKARLKYVLDAWGVDKFLAVVEEKLGRSLTRAPIDAIAARPRQDRQAHIGVHKQKQTGLNWIGVALPLGRLTPAQTRGLADIARSFGDGCLRLTVWQNVLVTGVKNDDVARAVEAIEALGLSTQASPIRAGLVACTGSFGCRFAAADTKQDAAAIADHCDATAPIDTPINIHLTGCHHSCAQHYIGDIGLIGARVPVNDEGDAVAGYHILAGGGFGEAAGIARELFLNVKAEDAPKTVAAILRAYRGARLNDAETFVAFARRLDTETIRRLSDAEISK